MEEVSYPVVILNWIFVAQVLISRSRSAIADSASVLSTSNAALNPDKYHLIVIALIGNGESISPSNTPKLRGRFPAITFHDNVKAQYTLLTKCLGITHVKAIMGFSMGAGQSFQWAVQYPDYMDAIIPWCGSARTSIHNQVFLEGQKSYLVAAIGGWSNGSGKGATVKKLAWNDEQKLAALKAFGRGYAGWGLSQMFYREKLYTKHFNAPDLESFLTTFWEEWALAMGKLTLPVIHSRYLTLVPDPENLLVMLQTWQLGDISAAGFNGDFVKALQSIKAKTLIMPSKTDLYFPPVDSLYEAENMAPGKATLTEIPSIWGHWAGAAPAPKEDKEFLDKAIAKFLSNGENERDITAPLGRLLL
jgi:pimeloyl-ACP methyl ester carboxylesterase